MLVRVDVDPGIAPYTVDHLVKLCWRAGFAIRWLRQSRSGSGKGWHLAFALDPEPTDPMTVVALQAVLGSDRYREACNICRVRNLPRMSRYWRERWNVTYAPVGMHVLSRTRTRAGRRVE